MECDKVKVQKPSRNIVFKSLLNFRDVGGIPASGNQWLKEGMLFRSANPDRLGKDDVEKLHSLNIRTIIDLRAPVEISKKPISFDHIEKVSLPLDFQKVTRERLRPVIFRKDSEDLIAGISNEIYLEILDASVPVFRQVLDTLASPDQSPALIHCHAGKDRTGIIVALVLLALGVDRSLIISDFMKSNEALIPYFKRHFLFRKIVTFGYFPYRNMLFAVHVKQRNIESVLDRIESHYGGIEGYISRAGIDSSRIAEVKRVLLEP
jgi:protein-tyrosine phosphatase